METVPIVARFTRVGLDQCLAMERNLGTLNADPILVWPGRWWARWWPRLRRRPAVAAAETVLMHNAQYTRSKTGKDAWNCIVAGSWRPHGWTLTGISLTDVIRIERRTLYKVTSWPVVKWTLVF